MGSGLPDLVSWWAEPGRIGWFADARYSSGFPWAVAGHGVGGLALAEPGAAPVVLPWPGVATAQRSLGWSDTVAVSLLEGAGWRGFGAPLVTLHAIAAPPGAGHARAVVQFIQGFNGFESDALGLQRGDSLSGFGVEMLTGDRGAAGLLEREGRHMWGVSGHTTRGRHEWAVSYAQRGMGELLASSEEEDAAGESGTLDYRYRARGWWGRVELARGYDHHESYGDTLSYSRRDAEENRAAAELGGVLGGNDVALRAEWRDLAAARWTAGLPVFERRASTLWGAGRLARAFGPGRLELALGGGRDDATGRAAAAPSLAYRLGGQRLGARLSAARLLQPVWSDLAAGQAPFLQSTWAAGLELGAAAGDAARARLTVLVGRTADRALVARLPLEELWLRAGLRADALRYRFALASFAGDTRLGPLLAGGEGFLLGRDRDDGEPQLDPSWGARAFAGGRFRLFQGDLDAVLRGEVEWVGERETEEAVPRPLSRITSFGAAAVFTLGDASLTVRARNLEDRPQEQIWIDPATGAPARGPGRDVRATLTWKLFN